MALSSPLRPVDETIPGATVRVLEVSNRRQFNWPRRLRDQSRSRLCEDAAIPTFYFHLDDSRDDQGTELKDVATAKCEAIKFAGRHVCDKADTFWDDANWTLTVADETNLTLFQLHIIGTESSAIRSTSRRSASA